jgi:nucleoside-diphosphate-sugar epimerase
MGLILITGSTGFIGRHLVNKLSKEGKDIISLSKSPSTDTIAVDLTCSSKTKRIVSCYSIETVVHLAGNVKSISTSADIDNEINMAVNVISALNAPCRFIYLSTADEYATSNVAVNEDANLWPVNMYAQAKFRTREALEVESKRRGIELIVLRPFLVYGLHQSKHMFISQLLNAIKNNYIFVYSARNKRRDFIHVSCLVAAISALVNHKASINGVFNIGTGIGTPLPEVVKIVGNELGIKVNFKRDKTLGVDTPDILVSNSEKLQKTVGWRSEIEISQGLPELIRAIYSK